jgi:DNA-binding transcriptional MerR regulator
MALTVSALAGQVGLSPDTIRYYKRVGLLPKPTGRRPATGSTTKTRSGGYA